MRYTKTFEAVVVRREYATKEFTGESSDSVILAFQVVAGAGVEKGQVFVEQIGRGKVWNNVPKFLLLRKGHKFTLPYEKEPEKPYAFFWLEMEIDAQQFAKDSELN